MSVTTVLQDTVQQTHDELCDRLDSAREAIEDRGQSSRGNRPIDLFLAGTSKHLHAIDAVLLPAVRRCTRGPEQVQAYLRSAKELEVVLAHVKAHEYGSAYETSFDWPSVWGDVDAAMEEQWSEEVEITDRLTGDLPDEQVEALAGTLREVEQDAPTRPHPYLPHTGRTGTAARVMMRVADSFWDAAEGRFTPERPQRAKKKPGLIGQYFLADPRFDEDR